MKKNDKRKIYFEKQSKDKLCGLHCLNSLLQAPYFDIIQLSEIALELDKQESLLLNTNTHENVDLDGNYNIQVLTQALKQYDILLTQIHKEKLNHILETHPNVEAFIFNSSTHWFSIRRIEGIWYDLNSTNKIPVIVSDFLLGAFIHGTMEVGYSNFLVENLPSLADQSFYVELQSYQLLFSVEEISLAHEKEQQLKLERTKGNNKKEKEEEDNGKFKAFSGKGKALYEEKIIVDDVDDDIKQAMEMSLNIYIEDLKNSLPSEPEEKAKDSYTIAFRFEEMHFQRRFSSHSLLRDLHNYCKVNLKTFSELEILETWPRKVYENIPLMISESGLSKNQLLIVKKIN